MFQDLPESNKIHKNPSAKSSTTRSPARSTSSDNVRPFLLSADEDYQYLRRSVRISQNLSGSVRVRQIRQNLTEYSNASRICPPARSTCVSDHPVYKHSGPVPPREFAGARRQVPGTFATYCASTKPRAVSPNIRAERSRIFLNW